MGRIRKKENKKKAKNSKVENTKKRVCIFKNSSCSIVDSLYTQDKTIKLDNSIEVVLLYNKVIKEGPHFIRSITLM